ECRLWRPRRGDECAAQGRLSQGRARRSGRGGRAVTSTAALGGGESGEAFRWPVCALVVLALHAIGLAALITWRAQVVPGEAPAVMLMMDLEPAPVPAPPSVTE